MIEFKNVTKEYKDVVALKDFNATIEDGEFVFLIGASGAGKSTFIRLLLRELVANKGEVFVYNRNLNEMRRNEIPQYRRKIGMVFQDFHLIPTSNVYENVAFAMRVTNARNRDIRTRVPEVLKMVGLEDKAHSFPHELSGGEQQRVSIARALVNKPILLIADEPTGNLDPKTSWGIMEILDNINRQGTTVVMATHAQDIVNTMKKRVIELDHGIMVRDEEKGEYTLNE